jgi:uncharacterized YigZ family protein
MRDLCQNRRRILAALPIPGRNSYYLGDNDDNLFFIIMLYFILNISPLRVIISASVNISIYQYSAMRYTALHSAAALSLRLSGRTGSSRGSRRCWLISRPWLPAACLVRGMAAAPRPSPSPEQLYILPGVGKTEEVIKKSRFVAQLAPVASVEEAVSFIESCRESRASHTCWAYVVADGDAQRSSDDGEPVGTAGRPMLAALTVAGMTNVAAAVTRYYGGINLGAGGLARAYGGAVSTCLASVGKTPLVHTATLTVTVAATQAQRIYALLNSNANNMSKLTEDFNEQGSAIFRLEVPAEELEAAQTQILQTTKGSAILET